MATRPKEPQKADSFILREMTAILRYREKAVITVTAVTERKGSYRAEKAVLYCNEHRRCVGHKPGGTAERGADPYNPISREDDFMRKREFGINIRVTESEKRKLELNARRCHLSLSAYLRRLGFGYVVQTLPQKEMHQIYKAVSYLENDLAGLSKGQIKRNCRT